MASVLSSDMRAISISVDEESGVSGLIWPGDFVDVISTQKGKNPTTNEDAALSETILYKVKVIAIDQEIVIGGQSNNAAAGKSTEHSVSLELSPKQANRIVLAKTLGKLSLAVRSVREEMTHQDTGVIIGCGLSSEIARQNLLPTQMTIVSTYANGIFKSHQVEKYNKENNFLTFGCNGSPDHPERKQALMISQKDPISKTQKAEAPQ